MLKESKIFDLENCLIDFVVRIIRIFAKNKGWKSGDKKLSFFLPDVYLCQNIDYNFVSRNLILEVLGTYH